MWLTIIACFGYFIEFKVKYLIKLKAENSQTKNSPDKTKAVILHDEYPINRQRFERGLWKLAWKQYTQVDRWQGNHSYVSDTFTPELNKQNFLFCILTTPV